MSSAPYLGSRPYGVQDRALFYGRQADVEALRSVFLGNPVSVLHAPSGAGKTSVLSAGLLPALEAQHQVAALCRPGPLPGLALRAAVIHRLLPSPAAEEEAISRLARELGEEGHGLDLPLAEVKRWYRGLPQYSERFRELVAGVPLPEDSPLRVQGAPVETTPALSRFLYLRFGAEVLIQHFARLEAALGVETGPWSEAAKGAGAEVLAFMERTTLRDVREFVRREDLEPWYRRTVDTLLGAEVALAEFFAHLMRHLRTWSTPLEIGVVLDQFEEFFTLFGERSEALGGTVRELVDYRVRDRFFEELGELLALRRPGLDGVVSNLPVRLLVSIRDDFVANLDKLESAVGPIDGPARFHLTVLRAEDAFDVIRRPARTFGYDYQDEVYRRIRDRLTEEGEIEPGHIQIVCSRLWRSEGAALHRRQLERLGPEADLAEGAGRPTISLPAFDALGGVRGILDSHFRALLESPSGPEHDRGAGEEAGEDRKRPLEDQIEILDMLSPLITSRHTRNIVLKELVLGRRFVDREHREALLEELRRENVVRVESHRTGDYVEISHEFLIEPIEREVARLRREEPLWDDLREALRKLEGLEQTPFRSQPSGLKPREIRALDRFRRYLDAGELRRWLAELMLRVSITELPSSMEERGETIARWAKILDDSRATLAAPELLKCLKVRREERRLLDHLELQVLADSTKLSALAAADRWFLLASAIEHGDRETTAVFARATGGE